MIFLTAGVITAQETMNHEKMDNGAKKSCCSSADKKSDSCTDGTEPHAMKSIDVKTVDKNKDGKVFQCPMCADQLADKSGKCAECGMNLKEVSVDAAQKALDGNGHMMMNESKMDGNKMDHSNMMNHKDSQKMEMKKENLVREGIIDLKAIDKNKDAKVFQCPMDWNVISDAAGKCPECNMKLKEVSLSAAKKNLKKNGYKVK